MRKHSLTILVAIMTLTGVAHARDTTVRIDGVEYRGISTEEVTQLRSRCEPLSEATRLNCISDVTAIDAAFDNADQLGRLARGFGLIAEATYGHAGPTNTVNFGRFANPQETTAEMSGSSAAAATRAKQQLEVAAQMLAEFNQKHPPKG